MSAQKKLESAIELVAHTEKEFRTLSKTSGAVFDKEQSFAIQALKNNDYLCGIAYNNKDSLRMAVLNVAAVGLTLNPVRKQAYLVPRDGKVCLDISYLGMIQLAADIGAIKWAKAEVVYEKDEFTYVGMNKEPDHKFTPFGDRGKIVGAYCVAKTHGDEYLTDIMPINEVYSIRDRSKAWIAYKTKKKSCPWVTDEGEMIKKTVIRRAYKSWPLTDTRAQQFHKAIEITNEDHEIIDCDPAESDTTQEVNDTLISKIKEMLVKLDRSEESTIDYLNRTLSRKIEKIEDMLPSELEGFERKLKTLLSQQKESEKEVESEDTGKDK